MKSGRLGRQPSAQGLNEVRQEAHTLQPSYNKLDAKRVSAVACATSTGHRQSFSKEVRSL
eukprot:5766381-Pleurochrysis_carterae.AAC.3